jgi:outer membrane protein assembly factor BamB
MKKWFGLSLGFSFATTVLCLPWAGAQALGNWTSPRNDMGHSGWQKAENAITKEDLSEKFKFLWKIQLGTPPAKDSLSYGEPLLVPRLINAHGFKDFVLWPGAEDLYAVDSELGTMLWTKHYDVAPTACGASNLASVAEAPPVINFRARRAAAAAAGVAPAAPVAPPPPAGPTPVSERKIGGSAGGGFFGLRGIYVLTGDGYLHEQVIATGADFAPPVKFVPGGVGISQGLGLSGKTIYTATKAGCTGVENALWSMTMNGADYPVTSYKTGSVAPLVAMGPTIEGDIAFAVTGAGKSDENAGVYASSIVALGPDAKVKDWYTPSEPGDLQNVTPVAFTYKEKKLLAAPGKDGSYVLLDTQSLGGSDHHTPLASTPPIAKAEEKAVAALASWQDKEGTGWVLASVPGPVEDAVKFANSNGAAPHGSIVAFKLEENAGKITLVPAWVSRDLVAPAPPVVANGLVIALSQGDSSTHAVLYVLDAETGKELHSTGDEIKTYAHMAGVAVGDGHAFFVTHDNTLYSFGIGIEH